MALLSLYGHERNQGYTEDLDSFKDALSEHGLEFRKELVWDEAPKPPEGSLNTGFSHEQLGAIAADALCTMRSPEGRLPFDGLLCIDEISAGGALRRLRNLGFEAGRDFKVASHSNIGSQALKEFEGRLSLLEFDPAEVAETLLKTLDIAISGEGPEPGSVILIKSSGTREPSGA